MESPTGAKLTVRVQTHMPRLQFPLVILDYRLICAADVYECLAVLLCCLTADTPVQSELVQSVLATVMEWRSSNESWFLFDRWQDALLSLPVFNFTATVPCSLHGFSFNWPIGSRFFERFL